MIPHLAVTRIMSGCPDEQQFVVPQSAFLSQAALTWHCLYRQGGCTITHSKLIARMPTHTVKPRGVCTRCPVHTGLLPSWLHCSFTIAHPLQILMFETTAALTHFCSLLQHPKTNQFPTTSASTNGGHFAMSNTFHPLSNGCPTHQSNTCFHNLQQICCVYNQMFA
jgi:hypothetical protein